MKVQWQFEQADAERVQALIKSAENDSSFQLRIANLNSVKPQVSKERFWRSLAVCLLTPQQYPRPSIENHQVINAVPFPLRLEVCLPEIERLVGFVSGVLMDFGGIRRIDIIGKQLSENLNYLESGGWQSNTGNVGKRANKSNARN